MKMRLLAKVKTMMLRTVVMKRWTMSRNTDSCVRLSKFRHSFVAF